MSQALNLLVALGLAAAASVYFSLGAPLTLEWIDEGQFAYPAWRVAEGALPYREFRQLFGPTFFLFNGWLFDLFGADLAVLRILMVLIKSVFAALVYLAARSVAPLPTALGVSILLVAVWGTPIAYFNTPYPSYYGILLGFVGVLLVLALPNRRLAACLLAGIGFGLAGTIKQTTGLFPLLALVVFLVAERRTAAGVSHPTPAVALGGRLLRGAALAGCLALAAFYVAGAEPLTGLVLAGPFAIAVTVLGLREWRDPPDARCGIATARELAALAAGTALPLLGYAAFYARHGLLDALVANTVTEIPFAIDWYFPLEAPPTRALVFALGLLGTFTSLEWARRQSRAAAKGWRAALPAAGAAASAIVLLGAGLVMGRAGWFRSVAFELLPVLALLFPWLALARLRRAGVPAQGAALLFVLFAATGLFYLHPAAEKWHVHATLSVFLPAAGLVLASALGNGTSGTLPRWARAYVPVFGAVLFLFLAGAYATSLRDALQRPVGMTFERATGIYTSGPYDPGGGLLIQKLRSGTYRDRSVLVISGQQMVYFLAEKVSALEDYELLLYLNRFDAIGAADARRIWDQEAAVARLEESRPVIIEDHLDTGARFRRLLPVVGRYIDEHYRLEAKLGRFRLLDRHSAATPAHR